MGFILKGSNYVYKGTMMEFQTCVGRLICNSCNWGIQTRLSTCICSTGGPCFSNSILWWYVSIGTIIRQSGGKGIQSKSYISLESIKLEGMGMIWHSGWLAIGERRLKNKMDNPKPFACSTIQSHSVSMWCGNNLVGTSCRVKWNRCCGQRFKKRSLACIWTGHYRYCPWPLGL